MRTMASFIVTTYLLRENARGRGRRGVGVQGVAVVVRVSGW
jgi:hypothetical protein